MCFGVFDVLYQVTGTVVVPTAVKTLTVRNHLVFQQKKKMKYLYILF